MKIWCPHCEWRPGPHDRWMCVPGCRTVWNTFETRGRCPGCARQWQTTCCLACARWSLHEAWYHVEPPEWEEIDADEELVEADTRYVNR